jgi:hypothetical protein
MFMRYRGGGVGHLGTRNLDSRLKENNNHELDDEEQDEASEAILVDGHEGESSYPHEERGNSSEEDDEDEGRTEDESEGKGKGKGKDGDEDNDDEDEEAADDDEILEEEGFAAL